MSERRLLNPVDPAQAAALRNREKMSGVCGTAVGKLRQAFDRFFILCDFVIAGRMHLTDRIWQREKGGYAPPSPSCSTSGKPTAKRRDREPHVTTSQSKRAI